MTALSIGTTKSLWEVFLLFAIPVGGGIPAGVLLAQKQGIGWVTMSGLYLISDILLAFLFEPVMLMFVYLSKRYHFLERFREAYKKSVNRTIDSYGKKQGPVMLVAVAFGIDPMTGRAAALAAGHNFISGWTIAIIGDMFFFGVIMASTIWLNNILGDGTWTAVIIMGLMIGVPAIIRRIKNRNKPKN